MLKKSTLLSVLSILLFAQVASADFWGDVAKEGREIIRQTQRQGRQAVDRYFEVNIRIAQAYDVVERAALPFIQKYYPEYASRAELAGWMRMMQIRAMEFTKNGYYLIVIANDTQKPASIQVEYQDATTGRWVTGYFSFRPRGIDSLNIRTNNRYIYVSGQATDGSGYRWIRQQYNLGPYAIPIMHTLK